MTVPALSTRWALHVALGCGALVAAAWLFAPALREFLQHGIVAEADRQVAAWLHLRTTPPLVEFMRGVSFLHGTAGILAMTALAALVLRHEGESPGLPALVAAVPGGLLLNVVVKHAVQRARPDWGYALQALGSFSFPSGHTAGATLFYGVIVVWLWPRWRQMRERVAALTAAAAMVLLVGASRIVLGVHFLSDCIGAVIEAGVWLAICLPGAHRRGKPSSAAPHGS